MKHKELLYVHPAPVRVWHWINAVGIVLLVLTGIQIRYVEMVRLFSLEEAVNVHNYIGFVVIANYGLWVAYYFGTGKIKIYFPNLRTFAGQQIQCHAEKSLPRVDVPVSAGPDDHRPVSVAGETVFGLY
jgi:thiosulfate reductase cytochrome b subunit